MIKHGANTLIFTDTSFKFNDFRKAPLNGIFKLRHAVSALRTCPLDELQALRTTRRVGHWRPFDDIVSRHHEKLMQQPLAPAPEKCNLVSLDVTHNFIVNCVSTMSENVFEGDCCTDKIVDMAAGLEISYSDSFVHMQL